jgi:hypothetical protein
MVRISKSTGALTGWKAVVVAVVIVGGIGLKALNRMNAGRQDASPAPAPSVMANSGTLSVAPPAARLDVRTKGAQ